MNIVLFLVLLKNPSIELFNVKKVSERDFVPGLRVIACLEILTKYRNMLIYRSVFGPNTNITSQQRSWSRVH